MIEIEGLTRRFDGFTAVDHLNLTVQKGSLFGFLGRNGAGKTTVLKMLSTVLRPTNGTARIGGFDIVKEALKVRGMIGVVGEGVETMRPFWTPMEYLRFFLGFHGLTRRQADSEAKGWLERLDLIDQRNRLIGNFSSGMRKRLELCRALSCGPRVLLLDEPTKELDIPGKREMWDLIRGLATAEGTTVFLCSHEVAEIRALCGDIAIIRSGRLGYTGSLDTLPGSVIKIVGTTFQDAVPVLEETLDLMSTSVTGTSLYVALAERVQLAEMKIILDSRGVPFQDLEEVRTLDERILAFL